MLPMGSTYTSGQHRCDLQKHRRAFLYLMRNDWPCCGRKFRYETIGDSLRQPQVLYYPTFTPFLPLYPSNKPQLSRSLLV